MSQFRHAPGRGAVFASILAIVLSSPVGAPRAEQKPILVLLPIRVHSSENPVYLQEGLSDMLVARFRQGGVFELKEIKDPDQSTTDLTEAVAVARDAGGDFVLFGSFTRFGAGASLDMQAAATVLGGQGDSMREIFVHSGSIAEVIPDLDDLVGKVTQFATAEYPPTRSRAGAAAGGENASEIDELKRRVADLETRLENLRAGAGAPAGGATR